MIWQLFIYIEIQNMYKQCKEHSLFLSATLIC